jgi:hypothetical protein
MSLLSRAPPSRAISSGKRATNGTARKSALPPTPSSPREIGGRGVAGALVERLVEDAERQGFLIRPDCSYVARKFSENPGWAALKA